ncbi:MAG: hypothetical protein ACPF9D_06140, partial [Owenweeksia sp.]
ITAVACQNQGHFKSEIATLDSLQKELNYYDLKLDSVNVERLQEIAPQVGQLQDYLAGNYPDSLDRSFWVTKMNGMTIVKKGAERYLANHEKVDAEIDYTREQLSNLRNSLKDEKIAKEDAEKYLADETHAVGEIVFYVNKLQGPASLATEIWDTLHPQMQAMADSLQALP